MLNPCSATRISRLPESPKSENKMNKLLKKRIQYMTVLKLRPPLVFASSHADLLLEGLGIMLKEVS